MKWIIAFLIFSILVLFHEFGHFIVAKVSGVEVEEFSLGFGPRLISTKFHGTRYSLKLLLFGGSCQMKSMAEEYLDEAENGNTAEIVPEEGSFEAASIGKRLAIVFAGPFFNFLLAFICAIVVISVVGYDPALVVSVQEGSAADEAGIKEGDLITEFMGSKVSIGRDLSSWFVLHELKEDDTVKISYVRDGEKHDVSFAPDLNYRYAIGIQYSLDNETAVAQAITPGSPLDNAGLKAGDVITSINGNEITTSESMQQYFENNPMDGTDIVIGYVRNQVDYEVTVTPAQSTSVSIGLSYNLGRVNTSAVGVLKYSFVELRYWISTTVKSLGALFTGRFGVNDLSGPVGVVDIVGTTYEETKSEGALMTWMNMLNLIILLSANLGVMNLLPIPALDGGKIIFLVIEGIRGKAVNKKIEYTATLVAASLLLILMVYVLYHDIVSMVAP